MGGLALDFIARSVGANLLLWHQYPKVFACILRREAKLFGWTRLLPTRQLSGIIPAEKQQCAKEFCHLVDLRVLICLH